MYSFSLNLHFFYNHKFTEFSIMTNGIVLLPVVPMRAQNMETSEMTSQLLYGEMVQIIESRGSWILVRNMIDEYEGWVDNKMITKIDAQTLEQYQRAVPVISSMPLMVCNICATEEHFLLPGGSRIYQQNSLQTVLGSKFFDYPAQGPVSVIGLTGRCIVQIAKQYLNSPYLWGGKTVLGIDCSGFAQVVYSICGMVIPRDADKQSLNGATVDFVEECKPGDLAFFGHVGPEILHVGIMISNSQIIHASGWVKIENIDNYGIVSAQTGDYTHELKLIKRLL